MAVSDKDVDHVRRAFESFNGAMHEREDEAGIRAHHARWYDPDVEIVNADDWPIAGSYRGTEGYVRWYQESYGPYEDVRYVVDFLGAVADRVVALVTISGRPGGTRRSSRCSSAWSTGCARAGSRGSSSTSATSARWVRRGRRASVSCGPAPARRRWRGSPSPRRP